MGGIYLGSTQLCCGACVYLLGIFNLPSQSQNPFYRGITFPYRYHPGDGVYLESSCSSCTSHRPGNTRRYFYGRPDYCFRVVIPGVGIKRYRFVSKFHDPRTVDRPTDRSAGRHDSGLPRRLYQCLRFGFCDRSILFFLRAGVAT